MPYLGRSPVFGQFYTQSFTPDGVASNYFLNYNAPSAPSLIVSLSGVVQEPYKDFNISADGAQLIFSQTPNANTSVFVTFLGEKLATPFADTGVSPGVYGSSTAIPVLNIGGDGRIKSASNLTSQSNFTYTNLTVNRSFAANVITANVTVSNSLIVKKITETIVDLGNTTTSRNIDLNQGTVFSANLNANCVFTISNASSSSAFTLVLKNVFDGNSIAWTGNTFLFPYGSASLVRTTTNNAIDVWTFFTTSFGNTWYVNIAMKDMKV